VNSAPNPPIPRRRVARLAVVTLAAVSFLAGCATDKTPTQRMSGPSDTAGTVTTAGTASAGVPTTTAPAPKAAAIPATTTTTTSTSLSLADIDRALADLDTQLTDADRDVATPEGEIR
jgi:hypothetical protein